MPENKQPRVVFSHGQESGPWGSKINHLAAIARDCGYAVDSIDYRGIQAAAARVQHLLEAQPAGAPLVLYGSSMGGYVAAMACAQLRPDGLFLLAPALYLPGYPGDPAACPANTVVVHGWGDDVVPCEQSLQFAHPRRARLHLVDDGHRLVDSLEFIGNCFERQLRDLLAAHQAA